MRKLIMMMSTLLMKRSIPKNGAYRFTEDHGPPGPCNKEERSKEESRRVGSGNWKLCVNERLY